MSLPPELPVAQFLSLLQAEGGAAEIKRRPAIRVRAALLAWLGLGDRARASELISGIKHPAVPPLRLALAVQGADEALLDACLGEARLRADPTELAQLGVIALFRGRDASQAADLLGLAGEVGHTGRRLALGVAAAWPKLLTVLAEDPEDVEALTEAAAVAQDRLSDAIRSRQLLERAYERTLAESSPVRAYVIERLLEVAEDGARRVPGRVSEVELLRAKLDALAGEAGAEAERVMTQYLLAIALERDGGEGEAGGLIAEVCSGAGAGFGRQLALRARARLEAKRGEWASAAQAWEALASDAGSPAWSAAYRRRAAELWEAHVGDLAQAETIWRRLLEDLPDDPTAMAALARLQFNAGRQAETVVLLSSRRPVRGQGILAALAEEALCDGAKLDRSAQLARWRELVTSTDPADPAHRVALEGAARSAHVAGDGQALGAALRELAALVDPAAGAAYLAVAGALALDRADLEEAATCLAEASGRDPEDLLCLAGRASLARRRGDDPELVTALKALADAVRGEAAQGQLHRELALCAVRLKDPATAQESYQRALELAPEDVSTLHAFARFCSDQALWPRAVELRERAARTAPGPRAALLLCEAAELREKHLSDDEGAGRAYEQALQEDATSEAALRGLAALHLRHRRTSALLAVLRRQLQLSSEPKRVLELQLEIARAAEQPEGGDLDAAVAAYRAALELDPGNDKALSAFERLCRREGRWEVLVQALASAERTPRVRKTLCDAFEYLERWGDLARVREEELAELDGAKEVAAAGRALAETYEMRLEDLDGAARAWQRVLAVDPKDSQALGSLQRIYEGQGDQASLAGVLERELDKGVAESERRLELWLKLADTRQRLTLPEQAVNAYQEVLKLDPRHGDALAALVDLYQTLGRSDELKRLHDVRASAANSPMQRSQVLQQKADHLEKGGDLDAALQAYSEAFRLAPESRICFTAYERLCYRLERWRQAMELYQAAIDLVEQQRSRAYRLADLYARKGQLQAQYMGQMGEAAASYLRVIELDPESDVGQTALERILSTQSDWRGLISAYERRAELMKEDARRMEVLRRAARVAAAKLKDAEEAARLYAKLHTFDPTDTEALDALERHYERGRAWGNLIGVLRTRLSLTAGGDEAIALYLRIAQLCEEGLRDADRAIEAYRKILEIAPSNKDAIEALGRLYEGTEKWAELVEVTRRQIRIATDRAQKAILYFKCGSVMESKFGKEDDAIRYYDAAIKTLPSCLPAVHGLRDLYLRRQDWPKVIQTLELEAKLWTEDKERAGVFAHLGHIYQDKLGEQERAIKYFESALNVDRECLPANRALFEIFFRRGEYVRALPIATLLTQKVTREGDPVERSEFYRKWAIVSERTGDLRTAVDSLVVALEIRPDNASALELLVSLCQRAPESYDFAGTFRELEKLYRRRDAEAALAQVLVAQGSLREGDYDIEGAEELYLEAIKLAPADFFVIDAMVSLQERLLRFDAAVAVIEAFLERTTDRAARSAARYRMAQVYGDGVMDCTRAAQALVELIQEDPDHLAGQFRLAQELYLLGRYGEARAVCDRLIQVAAAPERTAPPEALARYYDYLGRVCEAAGDGAASLRAYRRAADLDPAYPPTCIALARRAIAGKDRDQAVPIIESGVEAARSRGAEVELAMRRAAARFWDGVEDPVRALDAYGAVLALSSERADDRVAAAAILARKPDGFVKARDELLRVVAAEPRYVPAYRLLANIYRRAGEEARGARVASILALLGQGEAAQDPTDGGRRPSVTDEHRRDYLLPPAALGRFSEALAAVRETLEEIYALQGMGEAVPLAQVPDPSFKLSVGELLRLFGVAAEVWVLPGVQGGAIAVERPRNAIYVDADLLARPDGERRFVLGRAIDALRGGYALVSRLGAPQRSEVSLLLEQILKPEAQRDPRVLEFVQALPRKAAKAVERLTTELAAANDAGPDAWFAALDQAAQRAGLFACDDLGDAARALAWLRGESAERGWVSLDPEEDSGELVRFFLSDAYHQLRGAAGEGAR